MLACACCSAGLLPCHSVELPHVLSEAVFPTDMELKRRTEMQSILTVRRNIGRRKCTACTCMHRSAVRVLEQSPGSAQRNVGGTGHCLCCQLVARLVSQACACCGCQQVTINPVLAGPQIFTCTLGDDGVNGITSGSVGFTATGPSTDAPTGEYSGGYTPQISISVNPANPTTGATATLEGIVTLAQAGEPDLASYKRLETASASFHERRSML